MPAPATIPNFFSRQWNDSWSIQDYAWAAVSRDGVGTGMRGWLRWALRAARLVAQQVWWRSGGSEGLGGVELQHNRAAVEHASARVPEGKAPAVAAQ